MSTAEPDVDRQTHLPVIDLTSRRAAKVRVMLVEEDLRFASLVQNVLREAKADFDVECVTRLSAALARIVRDRIDIVITNLNLADSVGPRTVSFLKRAAPDVPIIVLSPSDDVKVALEAVRQGADEYVVKGTFSIASLVWLVRLVLERHRRVLDERGKGYVDGLSGVSSLVALDVVGRQLLRVADRTGLSLGVLFLAVEAAPRGRWADWHALLVWVSDLLQHTLRRCDLVARISRHELAVLLVSEGPHTVRAVTRVEDAIVAGDAGDSVRVGFSAYDREHPVAFDELLARARAGAQPVLA